MPIRLRQRGRPVTATSALIPAAARAPEALTVPESLLNAEAIETFAKAVGGRDQLADVLSVASGSPDIDKVASLLLNPRNHNVGLRRLCSLAGLTVADLFIAYKKALMVKAHVEATHIIAARLPPIVADVMDRAAPQPRRCPACQGASTAAVAPCPTCNSTGTILTEPDLDRQKLALELGQLTEKKAGILMQQNTIAASALTSTNTGALEQLHQAVGDLLFSPQRRRATAPGALPVVEATIDDGLVAEGGYTEPPSDIRPRREPTDPPWPLPTPDPETGDEVPDDDDENGDDAEAPRRR